jgi:hypothetical protein
VERTKARDDDDGDGGEDDDVDDHHNNKTFETSRSFVGRDSSVDITTRYGWTVRGSNPGRVEIFTPVQIDPGAHQASYTMGTGSFPGVKRPGRGADHPPLSSAEVKRRVEPYLYSPSGPSWVVLLLYFTLPKSLTDT